MAAKPICSLTQAEYDAIFAAVLERASAMDEEKVYEESLPAGILLYIISSAVSLGSALRYCNGQIFCVHSSVHPMRPSMCKTDTLIMLQNIIEHHNIQLVQSASFAYLRHYSLFKKIQNLHTVESTTDAFEAIAHADVEEQASDDNVNRRSPTGELEAGADDQGHGHQQHADIQEDLPEDIQ